MSRVRPNEPPLARLVCSPLARSATAKLGEDQAVGMVSLGWPQKCLDSNTETLYNLMCIVDLRSNAAPHFSQRAFLLSSRHPISVLFPCANPFRCHTGEKQAPNCPKVVQNKSFAFHHCTPPSVTPLFAILTKKGGVGPLSVCLLLSIIYRRTGKPQSSRPASLSCRATQNGPCLCHKTLKMDAL